MRACNASSQKRLRGSIERTGYMECVILRRISAQRHCSGTRRSCKTCSKS